MKSIRIIDQLKTPRAPRGPTFAAVGGHRFDWSSDLLLDDELVEVDAYTLKLSRSRHAASTGWRRWLRREDHRLHVELVGKKQIRWSVVVNPWAIEGLPWLQQSSPEIESRTGVRLLQALLYWGVGCARWSADDAQDPRERASDTAHFGWRPTGYALFVAILVAMCGVYFLIAWWSSGHVLPLTEDQHEYHFTVPMVLALCFWTTVALIVGPFWGHRGEDRYRSFVGLPAAHPGLVARILVSEFGGMLMGAMIFGGAWLIQKIMLP